MITELEKMTGRVSKTIKYRFVIPHSYVTNLGIVAIEKVIQKYYRDVSQPINLEDNYITISAGGFYEIKFTEYNLDYLSNDRKLKLEDLERNMYEDYNNIISELKRLTSVKDDMVILRDDMLDTIYNITHKLSKRKVDNI